MRSVHSLRSRFLRATAICCAILGAAPAIAHPHILATAQVTLVYSQTGQVTGLRQRWTYDPAYSAFATRQIAKSDAGALSEIELSSLAETQMRSLAEFGYFTKIKANDEVIEAPRVEDYGFSDRGGVLTLSFTQTLKTPIEHGKQFTVELHDPHFFAYFTWPTNEAARLDGAPSGCAAVTSGPQPIDLTRTRAIPAIFWAALDGSADAGRQFVNRLVVTCP